MDDGILIEAVRHHPEIYDKSHAGFKNPAIKQSAWDSIAQVVKASASDCTARWSTLRERFNKEKRKIELEERSGSGTPTSTWVLFGCMEFLAPFIRKRKSVSNFPSLQQEVIGQLEEQTVDDLPAYFNSNGHLVMYENESTVQTDNAEHTTTSTIKATMPSTSTSNSPRPVTSQQTRPGSSGESTSSHPSAASLPYLGPTGRCKKKKYDEANILFKETLSNLNKSIAQSRESEQPPKDDQLDPDTCIARNVDSSLRSLPISLKLGFRRKFRDLIQDCEEALYAYQQNQSPGL